MSDMEYKKNFLDELYNICIQVVNEVGTILSDYFSPSNKANLMKSITTKTSLTDYATEADEKAEAKARQIIKDLRPTDTILGEEQGEDIGTGDLIWVIDPLDGTTNFVYGIDAFAVSIAVAVKADPNETTRVPVSAGTHGKVLAGVVYNPIRKELFGCIASEKPLCNGTEISLSNPVDLNRSLIGTGFSYDKDRRRRQAQLLTKILPNIRDIRRFGAASLDLCAVASGKLDGYFEVGLKPWDGAAGVLIAEEAGACVREISTPEDGPMLIVSAPGIIDPLTDNITGSL